MPSDDLAVDASSPGPDASTESAPGDALDAEANALDGSSTEDVAEDHNDAQDAFAEAGEASDASDEEAATLDAAGCVPGTTVGCYTGPSGTAGIGACHEGSQTCKADGGYGPCEGEATPSSEDCDGTLTDEDCDGLTNEEGPNCMCSPNSTGPSCYTGPPGTEYVGYCYPGYLPCAPTGLAWQTACVGGILPTPENCAFPPDEDCDGVKAPECALPHWATGGEGILDPIVVPFPSGELLFAGSTSSYGVQIQPTDWTGGNGSHDIIVGRLKPLGPEAWSRRFPGVGEETANAVAVGSSGNIVIVGGCAGPADFYSVQFVCDAPGDALVVELEPGGQTLWAAGFGDDLAQSATAVALDSAGSVLLGGWYQGSINFGSATLDSSAKSLFLVKLHDQAPLWQRSIPMSGDGNIRAMVVLSDDSVVVAGNAGQMFDLGAGPLTATGSSTSFVARYSLDGQLVWSQVGAVGAADHADATLLARDSADHIYVAGTFAGSLTFAGSGFDAAQDTSFVIKLDTAGNLLWSRQLDQGRARALAANDNRIALTGHIDAKPTSGVVQFLGMYTDASNLFLTEFDSNGTQLWVRGIFAQDSTAVALDPQNDAVLSGRFNATAFFGEQWSSSGGQDSLFLIEYGP